MKKDRVKWFKDFVDHVFPLDIGLRTRELTPQIEEVIGILQFLVAAITVRENGYVKLEEVDAFIDLISMAIVTKKLDEFNSRSFFELAATPDPILSAQKWALMMLPLVAGTENSQNQKLTEVLSQWAMGLVILAKIQTCEACGDPKGAEKLRKMFRS